MKRKGSSRHKTQWTTASRRKKFVSSADLSRHRDEYFKKPKNIAELILLPMEDGE